ncbi:hypothetical protein GIB67_011928 [Kingdonia uniflora]|uniref:J domain-containing protein n=1 Tax=Kingdonia uniflora TaxID=39325 RepID=A0A7J7LZV6_9MAGN|nr:hypothetical protein GIB67_011928 [Kingdonia uniflora]
MASPLKAYSIPVLFLFLAIAFQLFITPSKFPPSHYDVLGIKRYSSIEEVDEAYEKISSKWNLGVEIPLVNDFVKVRYAFELLTNPLWKRDYDVFGVDEYLHLMEKVKGQYAGETFSKVDLPLLDTSSSDIAENAFNVLTTEGFKSTIGSTGARLIQVYSSGSNRSAQFLKDWKRIGIVLDGVASASMVELGEAQLATYLAERKSTGQPFFRNAFWRGMSASTLRVPVGLAGARSRGRYCVVPQFRYQGDLTVDAVTDWFATSILGLPRILFYAKETLGQYFIAKSGQHKVQAL